MKKEVSGQKLKYLLSVPEGKPDKNGWPLLLFLHGAGERGSDLEKVKVHGLTRDRPVSPQAHARQKIVFSEMSQNDFRRWQMSATTLFHSKYHQKSYLYASQR